MSSMFQFFLLSICVSTISVQGSVSWSMSSTSLPRPGSGAGIAYSSKTNLIWLVGGWNNGFQLVAFEPDQVTSNTSSSFTYNDENAFKSCTNLCNTYFWGQGYTQMDDILYMIDTSGDMFNIFNISSQQFTYDYDAISNIPTSIGSNGCLAHIGNYLIIPGATNYSPKVQIYNLSSSRWIYSANDMNIGRGFHACIVNDNNEYLYVIGGQISLQVQLDTVSKLYVGDMDNINQYNWTDLNDTLRVPTARIRAVIYGNNIYAMGGVYRTSTYVAVPYVDVILPNDVILSDTDLVQAVGTVSPIVVHNILFVLGGYNGGYKDYIQYAILPPTEEPTSQPTVNPTQPSANPSSNPSITPSASPTRQPIIGSGSTTEPSSNPITNSDSSTTSVLTPNTDSSSSTNKAGVFMVVGVFFAVVF